MTAAGSPLEVDSLGMWEATAALPEQVGAAVSTAGAVELGGLERSGPFSGVVVCGMGGSGIAGDVASAIGWPRMAVPVTVVKSYRVPAHVGPGTLVFAVSCSGDTEETLAAAEDARARGASVVAVAGPGGLAALADDARWPVVAVPGDIPQPRAAIGALSVPPLVVLERVGLVDGVRAQLRAAVEVLQRSRDLLVRPGSDAERIARRIGRTVPLVHGATGPGAVAAMRWKTQVNENAKLPAFFSLQPELCHNELAGWGQFGDVTRQALTVVMLRHAGDHPQVERRFSMVGELVGEVVASVIDVRTSATDDVAALYDLVLVGDFVSLHLAASEGVDPGPVPVLGELKSRLGS